MAHTYTGDLQRPHTRKAGWGLAAGHVLGWKVRLLITRPLLSTPTNGARDMKDLPRPCGNVIQTQAKEVTVS